MDEPIHGLLFSISIGADARGVGAYIGSIVRKRRKTSVPLGVLHRSYLRGFSGAEADI